MLKSLFIGNVGGCIGETSALLLLAGALFLIVQKDHYLAHTGRLYRHRRRSRGGILLR